MAGSLNKVMLLGHLGRDPEMRSTQDGKRIATFSMAMSESWKDKMSGERKERTEWATVVVFNQQLTEIVEKYLHKGSKTYVEGTLQTRKWTDQSGQDRYTTEVVIQAYGGQIILLGDPGGARGADRNRADDDYSGGGDYSRGSSSSGGGRSAYRGPARSESDDDLDSEIPF